MRRLMVVIAAFSLLMVGVSHSQTPRTRIFRKLMQQKLKSSQQVLEGLALADFKKVKEGAEELLHISSTEEWFAYKTKEYKLFSNEFRRAAEKLVQRAKAKNLDGTALSYVELTMTCVRCHQYVREQKDVFYLPSPGAH